MTEQDVIDACRKHGAKVVSDAAYAAMEGRPAALVAIGLGALQHVGALMRITSITYTLMSDDDQAADYTKAVIDGAKITAPPGANPAPGDYDDEPPAR